APRCPNVLDECRRTRPALTALQAGRTAACLRISATQEIAAPNIAAISAIDERDTLLRVEGLTKRYWVPRGLYFGRCGVAAVRNVDFSIAENEFVALVGESGSGKSTIARLLVGLEQPSTGRILIDGVDVNDRSRQAQALRIATVQMVFQDPQSALNPRRRVAS